MESYVSERRTKGRQKNGDGKNSAVYGLSVSYPQRRQSGKVSHLYGSLGAAKHENKRVRSNQFTLSRLKIRKIGMLDNVSSSFFPLRRDSMRRCLRCFPLFRRHSNNENNLEFG